MKRREDPASLPTSRCVLTANVGDSRTLVIQPSVTTHSQLTAEQQAGAGVKPASIRISVGYEDIDDIKADFDQSFAAFDDVFLHLREITCSRREQRWIN